MIIDQQNTTVILTHNPKNIKSFVHTFQNEHYPKYQNNNIIININSYQNLTLQHVIEFLKLSNHHRAGKQSFVIVNQSINPSEIPDEIVVVPTLQEAFDVIEMEDIERDLGV